ncbi:MAG: dihydrolipoyl dehydrogenase [Pseudomonadales bacterium]|nr:dihydrolipoyl dehydrogenase [Pseudomonadales bacterium]MBO6563715.1 dihydrolipoyl dehydrogenase [Pseudomonadales bacterium]MBO6596773.1 dihydrolipoyl dehydrogenase [Pseudomonadales bacterium]MBO6823238.1 dihydrolipoyl dehydrogenase [Pseudomonadales bacterium]
MSEHNLDVLVIGGGPGGYTAAIRASQLGLSVGLAEKAELGGVCLNWGCIPTKSLLHTADVLREAESALELGLEISKPKFNLKKVVKRSRDVAAQLSGGISHLMRKNKITVFVGDAAFQDKNTVCVGNDTIVADNIIVATGASARNLPHITVDHDRIWDARDAMTPTFMPKKLLIIGAGAIGVEFASFYNTMGAKVTLVEVMDQILPAEDAEIADIAKSAFEAHGIEVLTGTAVDEVEVAKKSLTATVGGESRKFDAVILSVGVSGNTEAMGLESLGVEIDRGFISVDEYQQTSVDGIYAIGDVAGVPCLAHKASHEGVIAVEAIAGEMPHPMNRERIPGCTYSHPQIASIGLSEAEAAARGTIKVGRFPLIANGKAVAVNDTDGMIKTIFDGASGELLGAHMIGPGVTEMIQGFAVAIGLETTEADLMDTIFPHPTLSEAMHESVLSAYGRTINF